MPGWAIYIIISLASVAVIMTAVRSYQANHHEGKAGKTPSVDRGMSLAVICHPGGSKTYRNTLRELEDVITGSGHGMALFVASRETGVDPEYYDGLVIVSEYASEGVKPGVRNVLQSNLIHHPNTAVVIAGRNYGKSVHALRKAREDVGAESFSVGIAIGKHDTVLERTRRFHALVNLLRSESGSRRREVRSRKPVTWISWRSINPLASRRHA